MTRAEIPETGQNIKGLLIRSHLQRFSADCFWCTKLPARRESRERVTLHVNRRRGQIHAGQFLCGPTWDAGWLVPSLSTSASEESASHDCLLKGMHDMKVLHPGSWPKDELDLQSGNAEVLLSCAQSERRERIHRICGHKEIKASCSPAAPEPRLKAVSTSKCEQAFSTMAVKLKEVLKKGSGEVQSVTCCSQPTLDLWNIMWM